MSRIAYLNGAYLPLEEARVPIMDRGFTFGDGIYEVVSVLGGALVDVAGHWARFEASLGKIGIELPFPIENFTGIALELVRRNELEEGVVYFQVTRGVAERAFACPEGATPTVVGFTQVKEIRHSKKAETGIALVSVPDLRWKRRDIKSIALLAQVMAVHAAAEKDGTEALMIEDGYVTEGGSSSVMIVTPDNTVVARPVTNQILDSITRRAAKQLCLDAQIRFEERLFTLEEVKAAREVFIASASSFVMPVTKVDGEPIGDGTPGPLAKRLRELYFRFAEATAVRPADRAA